MNCASSEFHRELRPPCWRIVVTVFLCCALLSACTSMQQVPPNDTTRIAQVVKPGDEVRCFLHNGTKVTLKVERVEPGLIASSNNQVLLKDVARFEVRRFSPIKTWLLVGGVVLIGVGVSALSNAALFPDGPFGPP